MIIKKKAWNNYIKILRKLDDKAADDVVKFMASGASDKAVIDYAYAVATRYGEAATEAACEMYDTVARASKANVPPAVPAKTATYGETARAVHGAKLFSNRDDVVGSAVGRLVKQAGVDTTMQNAVRDGAEWAWIPSGDTCAFCLTLASQGWLPASKDQMNGDHAEHIHNNCDCTFAIRFNESTDVSGYDPEEYRDMYYGAEGVTSKERINSMRREIYQKNKDRINEQKRSAYEKRIELNSSAAEELDVSE